MKLDAERLGPSLVRSLEPVYLISGDEPLLAAEAADAIRERARAEGHTERDVLFVEAGFNWGRVIADSRNLSLFADKKRFLLSALFDLPTGSVIIWSLAVLAVMMGALSHAKHCL